MAKIIIIDDEPAMVEVIVTLCREKGHQVFPFNSAPKAVEQLDAIAPQVVIADDGCGQEEIGYDGARGMGVLGMRERAAILGGALRIDSEPGRGTVVRATLERTRDRMPGDAP